MKGNAMLIETMAELMLWFALACGLWFLAYVLSCLAFDDDGWDTE